MPGGLRIAFVTSEMVPYAKTGGLADVASALPKALARLGHEVTVFLPRYQSIPSPPGDLIGSVHVPVDGVPRSAGYYALTGAEGQRVVFVDHPPFFDRDHFYSVGNDDYDDNGMRFAFLARAVLEYYRSRNERPDVFHCQDWQTGLLPVYLKALYWDDPTLRRTPTVFTIHNHAYQGNFPGATLGFLGLSPHLETEAALGLHGGVSYLKGGIVFSEIVTAVSPQYAQEIQGAELGYGLEGALRSRSPDLVGIVNGVDYDEWDPRVDGHIVRRYSTDDLAGKAACKADLQRTFGLSPEPDLPLVGVVSRLVAQKGLDLAAGARAELLARPLRMVVLGTGERSVKEGFQALAASAPDRFAAHFVYDNGLAHKIEAGCDMFLMPSRYEPCGLSQMYSLRYGTVPIVRATGGLVDTVEPYDTVTGEGTGFMFAEANRAGLLGALDEALAVYGHRDEWRRLMRNGMERDFSWERSARGYVGAYERAIAHA